MTEQKFRWAAGHADGETEVKQGEFCGRLDFLDGLRGVACLQVLLLHMCSAYFPTFMQEVPGSFGTMVMHSPVSILYNGWVAVFIFFILSGYVLTKAYDGPGVTSLRIEARVVRLWIPAAAFGVITAAMYVLFPAHDCPFLRGCWSVRDGVGAGLRDVFMLPIFTGYRNGLIPTMIPAAAKFFVDPVGVFNPPVWTLSVEMIGSLAVMGLVALRRKHAAGWLISMAVAPLASPMLAAFVVGHIAAIVDLGGTRRNLLSGPVGGVMKIALFGLGVYLASGPDNQASLFLGALAIFVSVVQSEFARRFLSSAACLTLGRRSVTIYLVHWAFVWGFGAWVLVSLDPVVPWQAARLFVAPSVVFIVLVLSGPLSGVDKLAVAIARRVARGGVRLADLRFDLRGIKIAPARSVAG